MKRVVLAVLVAAIAAAIAVWLATRGPKDDPRLTPWREAEFLEAEPAGPGADPAAARGGEECTTLVRARFLDPDNRPVAGVRLSSAWPRGSATSGSDGRVALALALVSESKVRSLHLRASATGFANVIWTAKVREDEATELGDIVLGPAGRVRGRVTDEQGQPIAMAEVRAVQGLVSDESARFHGPPEAISQVSTGNDGTFELDGVPVGPVRVWAGSTSSFWSSSDVIEVNAGAIASGVELVVRPIPPEHVIDVAVVDPDGKPVAGAEVRYMRRGGRSPGEGLGVADSSGRWRLIAEERVRHDLRARASEGELRPGRIEGIEPGSGEVVITLGSPKNLRVLVRDSDGAPIAGARGRAVEHSAFGELEHPLIAGDDEGTLSLALPLDPFDVAVNAEGFRPARLAALAPADAGEELTLVLTRLPRAVGLVHHGGEPIAGARVSLHAAPPQGSGLSVHGLPARFEPVPVASAVTADDGSFSLPLGQSGTFVLRAAASGWAATEAGPFELGGEREVAGLNIALERGATIEGRVLVDPGEALEGRLIAIWGGDPFPFTVRSDAEGRFVVPNLAAGRWWVGAAERELVPGTFQLQRTATAQPGPTANVELREGESSSAEVSFRAALLAHVRGRLTLAGRPAAGWEVRLTSLREPGRAARVAVLDADGAFVLGSPLVGSSRLEFFDPLRGARAFTLEAALELRDGEHEWSVDLPLARAQGRVLSFSASERPGLGWRFESGALRARGDLALDPDGTFVVPRIPSGELRFVRRDAGGEDLEVRRATVPALATLDLEL